jgi:Ca-activated chloride channel family protein
MKPKPVSMGLMMIALGAVLACRPAFADSAAAKNKEGNRLFQQGKYQDAEKTYLDAQLDEPGRPELLYNLGNTLIRQKKYDPAIQSLRQATSKADRGLQASSWYNLGNALFESGKLPDAAQAYIQALRINPSDRSAKYNLELALRRMNEQKQSSSGKGSSDDPKKEEGKQDSQTGNNQQQNQKDDQKQDSRDQQDKNQQQQQPVAPADRREGGISKERALQILDAMKNQELAEQRKLQERQARRKSTGRDW